MEKFKEFDERQLMIRGNIFKHMVLLFAGALLLNGFLKGMDILWADGFYPDILILIFVIAAGSIEMIWRGAYISVPGAQRILLYFLGAVSSVGMLFLTIDILTSRTALFTAGRLTGDGATLCLNAMLLCVFINFFIKYRMDRKKEEN